MSVFATNLVTTAAALALVCAASQAQQRDERSGSGQPTPQREGDAAIQSELDRATLGQLHAQLRSRAATRLQREYDSFSTNRPGTPESSETGDRNTNDPNRAQQATNRRTPAATLPGDQDQSATLKIDDLALLSWGESRFLIGAPLRAQARAAMAVEQTEKDGKKASGEDRTGLADRAVGSTLANFTRLGAVLVVGATDKEPITADRADHGDHNSGTQRPEGQDRTHEPNQDDRSRAASGAPNSHTLKSGVYAVEVDDSADKVRLVNSEGEVVLTLRVHGTPEEDEPSTIARYRPETDRNVDRTASAQDPSSEHELLWARCLVRIARALQES